MSDSGYQPPTTYESIGPPAQAFLDALLLVSRAINAQTQAVQPPSSGIAILSSGTVTTPVSSVDLLLPEGYASFRLLISGVSFSADDILAFAFSTDGGVTWLNDPINFDTYMLVQNYASVADGAIPFIGPAGSAAVPDALGSYAGVQNAAEQILSSIDAMIIPGSTAELGQTLGFGGSRKANFNTAFGWVLLNPLATVPPTPARINAIRIKPYDDGATAPATHLIETAVYTLWGQQ